MSANDHQTPEPTASVGELASLPVFWKLAGKRVVMAGEGAGLPWKIQLVAATGAQLDLFCPDPHPSWPDPAVLLAWTTVHGRRWTARDFAGAALAIGDFASATEAADFAACARAAGVPVNVVDTRELSDFEFGALVDRSPLLIAISTDGAAPILAQNLRGRLEAWLPSSLRQWALAAKLWRPSVQARWRHPEQRRRFWDLFVARALADPDVAPTDSERDRLMDSADEDIAVAPEHGGLTIVGVGPGDPELLTLRALRALHAADAIVFGRGTPTEIIAMSRREAIRLPLTGAAAVDILTDVARLLEQGKQVAWLVDGDARADNVLRAEIAALTLGHAPILVAGVATRPPSRG